MGSTGAFLNSGGFGEQGWDEVGKMFGIKILQKRTVGKECQSLPPFSNTPGTAYVLLNPDGSFKQYRQYKEDRSIDFDIDYGKHAGKVSLHKHNGRGDHNPTIIASKEDGIVNKSLYNKFKKFLKGLDL